MKRKVGGTQNVSNAINITGITERLQGCPDIIQKKVYIDGNQEASFFYIESLIDKDLLQRDFIRPILSMSLDQLYNEQDIHNLPCLETDLLYDNDAVIKYILAGKAVFVCDALPHAISCIEDKMRQRAIDEPATEKNIRGSHEGFVEQLDTNLSILRRKIKNDRLKFRTITLGTQTNQTSIIAYIDGIADLEIVNSLFNKVSKVKFDGLPAIGYIEQSISTHQHSLFPEFIATERPDRAASALLEGRIVILLDGTPVVLIAPVSFISFLQSVDDYSTSWIQGSFLRMVRISALLIAVFLPAIYISAISFHYYTVPLKLLIPLAESRARVPFPPILEVLILEAIVEMVREAAVRLPTYIGTSISVFASLVIGQAAVEAGIVSNILIIIVAASAVASYVIPSFDMAMAIRILRFGFTMLSSFFGMIGIIVLMSFVIFHLISMESLGQPYFQPFAPLVPGDLKDSVLRLPLSAMRKRTVMTKTKNRTRSRKDAGKSGK